MTTRYIFFAVTVFLLNFVWESWHAAYLYADLSDNTAPMQAVTFGDFVQLITYVSIIDAGILSIIFLGGVIVWRQHDWFMQMDTRKYAYFAGVAILWAICIEYKAVFMFDQWSYSSLMPTIFGLGVSPLMQLAATGLGALWITRQAGR